MPAPRSKDELHQLADSQNVLNEEMLRSNQLTDSTNFNSQFEKNEKKPSISSIPADYQQTNRTTLPSQNARESLSQVGTL